MYSHIWSNEHGQLMRDIYCTLDFWRTEIVSKMILDENKSKSKWTRPNTGLIQYESVLILAMAYYGTTWPCSCEHGQLMRDIYCALDFWRTEIVSKIILDENKSKSKWTRANTGLIQYESVLILAMAYYGTT